MANESRYQQCCQVEEFILISKLDEEFVRKERQYFGRVLWKWIEFKRAKDSGEIIEKRI